MGWLQAIGYGLKLYGAYKQSKSAGENDRVNAVYARSRGLREAANIRKDGKKHIGRMRVAIAKSGFRSTGSVMEEVYRTAGDIEANAQEVLASSTQSANSYLASAGNSRSAANAKFATTALSIFSNYYN